MEEKDANWLSFGQNKLEEQVWLGVVGPQIWMDGTVCHGIFEVT